jgi:hypothetical protein
MKQPAKTIPAFYHERFPAFGRWSPIRWFEVQASVRAMAVEMINSAALGLKHGIKAVRELAIVVSNQESKHVHASQPDRVDRERSRRQ